jgi:hypothetical protein
VDKIPTLFLRNPENMSRVLPEINPEAAWLSDEPNALVTIKKDGTNVRVWIDGDGQLLQVGKRTNPSKNEKRAAEAIGSPAPVPHYQMARRVDPSDKHIFAAVDATEFSYWPEGTWPCEALGPKIQGGVESDVPALYPFSLWPDLAPPLFPLEHDAVADYLGRMPHMEGIVWHGSEGKMCKIKRRDFGLPWPPKSG